MKNITIKILIFLPLFMLLLNCGPRYYLQRAKINTYKAIARGAKIDSLKIVTHDTITVNGVDDVRTIKEVHIDTVLLKQLCPEIKTQHQQHELQKLVCPDIGIDTTYRINVIVDGLKHPVLLRIKAYSRLGKTYYALGVKAIKMGYKKVTYNDSVNPGNTGLKWWHLIVVGVVCLLIGFIVGKIFSIGVKL